MAQDFTVQYMDSYKVGGWHSSSTTSTLQACLSNGSHTTLLLVQIVTNLFVNETYILYQCGTTRPTADVVPAGSKFFEIPLTSVTVLETIPYAYLVSTGSEFWCFLVPLYTMCCPWQHLPLCCALH